MKLEKIELFSTKREFFLFLSLCGFILIYALLIEYNNYKNLTQFDSNIVTATVIKQYPKTKITKKGKRKTYQVLKLKSPHGFSFYTTAKNSIPNLKNKKVKLEIWAGKISFYDYMTSFYAYSKILYIYKRPTLKQKLNRYIESQHTNKNIDEIYQALYTATTLNKNLQNKLSSLGISHLIAISGFHLGVLSFILFFLLKYPYKFLQNRYFPYRSYAIDSFIIISFILFGYLVFLDYPPSLIRAFFMLIIAFILYDRGIKVLSMQTLFLTIILLLSFEPRLFFQLGFWLSVSGVFYIFLFIIHFSHLHKIWQFILIPIWVYLLMLPFSLTIFSNFSIYHPFSILWTSLFTLFYPISILLHIFGFGNFFDSNLEYLLSLNINNSKITLNIMWLIIEILLSFLALFKKNFIWLLLLFSFYIFIYSIYYVT